MDHKFIMPTTGVCRKYEPWEPVALFKSLIDVHMEIQYLVLGSEKIAAKLHDLIIFTENNLTHF